VKRRDLIRELVDAGCYFDRHGKKHDIYVNLKNGKKAPVPRHSEIKDSLCGLINQKAARDQMTIKRVYLIHFASSRPHKKTISCLYTGSLSIASK